MSQSLESFVDKVISVITSDGRNIVGLMKGFDQTINIVLEDSHERVFSEETGVEQIPLGLYVIRGDNVAVIGELDEELDKRLDFSKIKAAPLGPVDTNTDGEYFSNSEMDLKTAQQSSESIVKAMKDVMDTSDDGMLSDSSDLDVFANNRAMDDESDTNQRDVDLDDSLRLVIDISDDEEEIPKLEVGLATKNENESFDEEKLDVVIAGQNDMQPSHDPRKQKIEVKHDGSESIDTSKNYDGLCRNFYQYLNADPFKNNDLNQALLARGRSGGHQSGQDSGNQDLPPNLFAPYTSDSVVCDQDFTPNLFAKCCVKKEICGRDDAADLPAACQSDLRVRNPDVTPNLHATHGGGSRLHDQKVAPNLLAAHQGGPLVRDQDVTPNAVAINQGDLLFSDRDVPPSSLTTHQGNPSGRTPKNSARTEPGTCRLSSNVVIGDDGRRPLKRRRRYKRCKRNREKRQASSSSARPSSVTNDNRRRVARKRRRTRRKPLVKSSSPNACYEPVERVPIYGKTGRPERLGRYRSSDSSSSDSSDTRMVAHWAAVIDKRINDDRKKAENPADLPKSGDQQSISSDDPVKYMYK